MSVVIEYAVAAVLVFALAAVSTRCVFLLSAEVRRYQKDLAKWRVSLKLERAKLGALHEGLDIKVRIVNGDQSLLGKAGWLDDSFRRRSTRIGGVASSEEKAGALLDALDTEIANEQIRIDNAAIEELHRLSRLRLVSRIANTAFVILAVVAAVAVVLAMLN